MYKEIVMREIFGTVQNSNYRSFLIILVLFALFSTTTVFGQNEVIELSTSEISIVIENPEKVSSSSKIDSNVNFILWFMGTKEDFGKTYSNGDVYSKKSFLTSGREPNRLLVKTLLKKALNIKSC